MASYQAWRERHGLVDFSKQVRGGKMTPCFESPEKPLTRWAQGAARFLDAAVVRAMQRSASYRKYLLSSAAAGRGLTHARLVTRIYMVEVGLHQLCGLRDYHELDPFPTLWTAFETVATL